MTRTEEIAAILDEFIPRLNALRDAAMEEIAAASETASTNIARHAQASEESARLEVQIGRLKAERETLPDRAYRAGLDEAWEEEDRLKERYRNLKPALEGLEERKDTLRREIHSLNPKGGDHPNDVVIEQYAEVAGVAYGPRAELEALKKKLSEALDASINPVIQQHDSWRSTTWQLGHERSWDQSPVGRGAVQG